MLTRIGRYEIISKIGAGGMGEVFLARDPELQRKAAIKILAAEFSLDAERRQRFKQEARAASALNHPNILTVYEIGEAAGQWFIAAEFIEGQTLRELIKNSPLDVVTAVRIAEQIAQALTAAHANGIVHRDIKPENVMIRADGYVKVLDFGLAKPTRSEQNQVAAENASVINTTPGIIIGSVRYMSPEQARGLAVDRRSDVWSLGVVLYEMIAGRAPFDGATTSDALTALIHLEPAPLTQLAPPELQRIVRKALQKNVDERYQSSRDLMLDLKNLLSELEHGASGEKRSASSDEQLRISENPTIIHQTNSAPQTVPNFQSDSLKNQSLTSPRRILQSKWAALLMLAIIGVAAAVIFFGYRALSANKEKMAATAFERSQTARLESDGKVRLTAISPDGKYVAYASGEIGSRSLVVRQISTDSTITIVPPTPFDFAGVSFTPSGDYVYYTQTRGDFSLNTLYKIPTLGGTPQKIVEDVDSPATFAPDGKQIAFLRHNTSSRADFIFVANADGSNLHDLISTKQTDFTSFAGPIWSPNAAKLLVGVGVERRQAETQFSLAEISVSDGALKLFGAKKWAELDSGCWFKDGSGILLAARETADANSQIWRVAYPGGETGRVTNDFSNYYSLGLAADGATAVAVRADSAQGIWTFRPADKDLAQLVPERRNLLLFGKIAQMADGRLLFARRENNQVNLWTVDQDGANERRLLNNADATSNPAATTDGRLIVFASKRSGASRVWRVNVDGSNLVQLTDGELTQNDYYPQLTADNRYIIFQRGGNTMDTMKIYQVSIDGGQSKLFLNDENAAFWGFRFSPDKKRVAYTALNLANYERRLQIARLDDDLQIQAERGFDFNLINSYEWSPDGKSLTYQSQNGVPNLWRLSLDNGNRTPITDFKIGQIYGFAWSRDGKKIFIVRGAANNDLMLIRNENK